jgi:hypothetical protein
MKGPAADIVFWMNYSKKIDDAKQELAKWQENHEA